MFIRPGPSHTPNSIAFVQKWADLSSTDKTENDQCHLQRLAMTNIANVCHLDPSRYINGHAWIPSVCHQTNTCVTRDQLKHASMVHANYVVGAETKMAALRQAGFWKID